MGFIEYTYEKVVCGLMSEIEFKTSSHFSKIWILHTMQRFKLYDTFVYAQFYEILENILFKFQVGDC